jgi:hypothetical protein
MESSYGWSILRGERKATPYPHEILSDRITGSTWSKSCGSPTSRFSLFVHRLKKSKTHLVIDLISASDYFSCYRFVLHDYLSQAVIYGIPGDYHYLVDPVILSKNTEVQKYKAILASNSSTKSNALIQGWATLSLTVAVWPFPTNSSQQ